MESLTRRVAGQFRCLQAFSLIGLVPDSAGTYFLPRLIGFQKALALAMLGDKIGAKEAEKLGISLENLKFLIQSELKQVKKNQNSGFITDNSNSRPNEFVWHFSL